MAGNPTYPRQSHLNKVLAASASKDAARKVLLQACIQAGFDVPEVTFTKDQLCDILNTSRSTVQRGLRELREEGSLVAVRNHAGGRGIATTYSIRVVGQGAAADKPVARGRGEALDDPREKRFRSLSRKFGAMRALEMMETEDA